MSDDAKHIIINDDRLLKSIIRDTYTFAGLLACVGIGVWVSSTALQWTGGIMWVLAVISIAYRKANSNRKTIKDAKAYLDELEAAE